MKGYLIEGGRPLRGEVTVAGAKNAALPVMAASILTDEPVCIQNAPSLRDVRTFAALLGMLGLDCELTDHEILLSARELSGHEAPYDLVKQMRASVLVLGPLLARTGEARVSLPGGCAIGERPVDQHLKGLRAMGAEIEISHGYIEAKAKRLAGAKIYLDFPTVTGTENLMMAATLAEGETIIENAAREPEIVELAEALTSMGADIRGAGEVTIVIRGTGRLGGLNRRMVPDRIEAATYLAAGMITGGEITVKDCRPDHLEAVILKMKEAGGTVEMGADFISLKGPARPKAVDIKTMPHPGFPTDMQAQMMAMMAVAEGNSLISENVFENRFMHAAELNRMGADITVEGHTAVVSGVPKLSGAQVMATDLRAGAALVIAGLVAEGRTSIARVYHIERGYEKIVEKLTSIGAFIREINIE